MDTLHGHRCGTDDLGQLVDPRKASGYKHFLALAGVAQLARACACQAQGRRFDPGHPLSGSRDVRWLDHLRIPPVVPGVVPE
jgi:hypothetical protein